MEKFLKIHITNIRHTVFFLTTFQETFENFQSICTIDPFIFIVPIWFSVATLYVLRKKENIWKTWVKHHLKSVNDFPLTLSVPIPDEKRELNFNVHTSLWCLKSLKGLKAFIKPVRHHKEAWKQKTKVKLIFILIQLSKMHGAWRV